MLPLFTAEVRRNMILLDAIPRGEQFDFIYRRPNVNFVSTPDGERVTLAGDRHREEPSDVHARRTRQDGAPRAPSRSRTSNACGAVEIGGASSSRAISATATCTS